jgi:hypothetical protein
MPTAAKQIAIVLSASERDALAQLARGHGEPLARVAARAVRSFLSSQADGLGAAPARRQPRPPGSSAATPPWLPREHAPESWWTERLKVVAGMQRRYPAELAALPAEWRDDALIAEQLLARATWRDQLDAGVHDDPRMELAFASALLAFARQLDGRRARLRAARHHPSDG